MGLFKNLKATKDHIAAVKAAGVTDEVLAALTPEQRAAYESHMTPAAAESVDAAEALKPQATDLGTREVARAPLPKSTGGPADAASELASRTQAALPYLSPVQSPVRITRIATTAGSQIDDVAEHLAATGLAGRPDLVFGVYEVPDHIGSNNVLSQARRYVEWDIVHTESPSLAPAASPGSAFFPASHTWVKRDSGEPSILDEDVALMFLREAGVQPEQCCGIARVLRTKNVNTGDGGEVGRTISQVVGVQVFATLPGDVLGDLASRTPLEWPGPWAETHIEVLDWGVIADRVRPDTGAEPPVPSPFPHLPSTPQELLRTYLEIVGVNPADSFSAQVTEDDARDLNRVSESKFFTKTSDAGDKLPSVDGKSRRRLHGGSRVVLAYRDRPEYAEGRARWAAYQREVLQTTLEAAVRRPVESLLHGSLPSTLRRAISATEKALDFILVEDSSQLPPHRYCWPPQDVR